MAIRKAPATPRPVRRSPGLRTPEKSTPQQVRRVEETRDKRAQDLVREIAQSGVATHALAEGLEKTKAAVEDGTAAKTRQQLDELAVEARGGAVTRRELAPEFRAAQQVAQRFGEAQLAQLEDEQPQWKAAFDAVAPEVTEMARKTAGELRKNPEALARVQNVVARVGQEGFRDAVAKAAPDVGEAFSRATGVQMMNEPVVKAALDGLPALAERVAPAHADKLAKGCAAASAKLGLTAATETVEAVAKGAAKEAAGEAVEAVAKGVAKEAAGEAVEAVAKGVAKEAAGEAVEAGAKVAAKGAAGAGKAVPVVGNVIAVGSTCLAAVGLVREIAKSPRDAERIAKEGVNTLLQGVGIAFPWAALGGDLMDVGWSAKLAVQDAKAKGASPEQAKAAGAAAAKKGPPLKELAPVASEPARALAAALDGAGHAGVGKAFRDVAKAADDLGSADSPQARADWKRTQTLAFSQLASTSQRELEGAAKDAATPGERDALETLAHGFGELFRVLYAERKGRGSEKTQEDRSAKLMGIVVDATRAAAALATDDA